MKINEEFTRSVNPSIKIIPFPDVENAFIVISAGKTNDDHFKVRKNISLVYATEKGGAEWEPDFGPITILTPCDKNHESAKSHWLYPFFTGNGNWSQCAVERERLPSAFLEGDYNYIFSVLKRWASREEETILEKMEVLLNDPKN
jgi:hypothetical protein